jgi:hypothetical protein
MSKKGAIRNMPLNLIRFFARSGKMSFIACYYLIDNTMFSLQEAVFWQAEKSERGHEKWAR